MATQKASAAHSLHQEIEAARVLLANIKDILGDDAQARADAVEGETDLRAAIESGMARVAEIVLQHSNTARPVDVHEVNLLLT